MRLTFCLVSLVLLAAPAEARRSPSAALDELLRTERNLSGAAAGLSPAEGIASLIGEEGLLFTRPAPVIGPAAAKAALGANPANQGRYARWQSIRAGVSADGQHGFTLGYLTIEGAAAPTARRRYLAYWVRAQTGWRVAVFKQLVRSPDEATAPSQPPVVPGSAAKPDARRTADHRTSLIAAEKAFSDRAQTVGLTKAFAEYGRPDAIHLGGPHGFAIGLPAVTANFGEQGAGPATINWSADRALVASSGDLGVTIGAIRSNGPPPEGQPASVPFFTIWYRDDPSRPWRYIAE